MRQGDVALLSDPVAKELLESRALARLAYTWRDGSPRVVPIWFHWTGSEIVMGSPPRAPKVAALPASPRVAISIDADGPPAKALLVRGMATVEVVVGIVSEYAQAAQRYLGEGADEWLDQVSGMGIDRMARIGVVPDWVAIIDFETRFPSALPI